MLGSLSKLPGGKCVKVGRSLVEGRRGKVSIEIFNPSDEDVLQRGRTLMQHWYILWRWRRILTTGIASGMKFDAHQEDECQGTVAGSF